MKLSQVLESSDPRQAFNLWLQKNKPRLARASKSIWFRYVGREPDRWELEDLIQEVSIVAWQAIEGYRWICPGCRSKLKNQQEFRSHAGSCGVKEPLVSIDKRVYYQTGSRCQRVAKSHVKGRSIDRRWGVFRDDLEAALKPLVVYPQEVPDRFELDAMIAYIRFSDKSKKPLTCRT